MTRDHSDRINEIFATISRDVAPACCRQILDVLYAPYSGDPGVSELCSSVLSDIELQRADRFVKAADRTRFEQGRAFRRYCGAVALGSSQPLSQVVFQQTEKGRPYLGDVPQMWFSFSSCQSGFLGAWSSTYGIGVDLEDQRRNLEAVELAHQFYSPAEANAVEQAGEADRLHTFFQLWTLKEAALKSIGEGLPFGLDAFEFELHPNLSVVHAPPEQGGPGQFNAHLIEGASSCAALVIRSPA